ncbi:type II toxin-antitoxin system Phd/YefM family antitoxin [Spiractinospora alimapuensis]|uniref:type II toxin-antitoxin system Phd/YefM family antitoxin n=1 Tax=Spiractinospora alimapuensis TaxID=2820884 RepID=UPI001F22D480|nr:type II toxin-antitoxin system Phd/YefM family antitoxin [Spiractinospora alimapuensis]
MTVVTIEDARAKLSRIVDAAVSTHERATITRNGTPVAVLVSLEDFEAMRETIDILAHPELMEGIREGMADLAAGHTFTEDEIDAALREAGRA